ncbi:SAV_6107 family HEPN domain-containing protein [Actinopolymorpha alba]|uniref:SAV_6107 family HEPN domain-containing protein n=1 Tax=Actinopolymorpha alba TaxID=533267 RepID=UPI000363088B|nr:SAV_6107 family HEPN domain-containing protein [Actinopolymorpha alba]
MPTRAAAQFQAPLGPSVFLSLDRARASLADAMMSETPAERYVAAHVAALRTAAAVLAARARPAVRRGQRNAWALLTRVAPELGEWATFFAAGAGKRAAAEAGLAHTVTAREADDLVRDAERFLAVVERLLELPHQPTLLRQVDEAGGVSPAMGVVRDLSRSRQPGAAA